MEQNRETNLPEDETMEAGRWTTPTHSQRYTRVIAPKDRDTKTCYEQYRDLQQANEETDSAHP